MGMPSAQVQSGTQPQGKGFSQPVNPPAPMMGPTSKIGRLPPMISDELAAPAVMPDSGYGYQPQQQNRGKGGSTTNTATSGQPMMGQPNRYPNTVGQWDNASIQRQSPTGGGKGKG